MVGGHRRQGTGGGAVVTARFRMTLPAELWITETSTRFPDATFRLLSGAPVGDRTLELGEVLADDPVAVVAALRDHPDVVASDPLFADDGRALVRYETTDLALYEFLAGPSLPPVFPVVVEDGEMEFDLTASRETFEAVGETLDASGLRYDLLSVVHHDESGDVLTARQREVLTVALREGYFAVPREATLASVAAQLDVDKSSASETIRRGVGRVLTWFLAGPTRPTAR